MKSKQHLLFIVFSLFAGFIGGFISNQIFQTKSAFAEKGSKPDKIEAKWIEAQHFALVDEDGSAHAHLHTQKFNGKPQVFFGITTDGKTGFSIEVNDQRAELKLYQNDKMKFSYDKNEDKSSILLGLNKKISYFRFGSSRSKEMRKSEVMRDNIFMASGLDKTFISLADSQGNLRANIGNADITKGKTGILEAHPVSSIVLFNEKGSVVWSAP